MNKRERTMAPKLPFNTGHLALAGVLAVFAAGVACSGRQPEAKATPPAHVQIVKGEPPAASELALLMREMTAFTDSTGKRLIAGEDLLPFPEQFKALKTAGATPGMVEHSTFDPYADAWLHHLNALYTGPAEERADVFNTLVNTCAGCHGQMCPGPLARIRKLAIPGAGQ